MNCYLIAKEPLIYTIKNFPGQAAGEISLSVVAPGLLSKGGQGTSDFFSPRYTCGQHWTRTSDPCNVNAML